MNEEERNTYIRDTVKDLLDKAAQPGTSDAVNLGRVLLAAKLASLLSPERSEETPQSNDSARIST